MKRTHSFLWFLLFLAIALTGSRCQRDGCEPEATRCNGTRVEICDSETDWGLAMDCSALEPYEGEICCWVPEIGSHGCDLPEYCGEVPDAD